MTTEETENQRQAVPENSNERITSMPPSQVEMLRTAATRLRQSGKTTLASGLEAIVNDYGNGQPIKMVIPALPRPTVTSNSGPQGQDSGNNKATAYVPHDGEVDLLKACIDAGLNVLLTGPTSCGKTTLVDFVAAALGRNVYTIQGGEGATFERIIAKDALENINGATVTVRPSAKNPVTWSVLPNAMNDDNGILYLDEPNAIPNEVLFYLYSAMDYRRTITFDDGTTLKAKKGFVVIGAMNEGQGYSGTNLLNHAFRSRCEVIIDLAYLAPAREAKLLVERTGIEKETAKSLCCVAKDLRAGLALKTIRTPIGTRSLLATAKLIKYGMGIKQALTVTLTNQVSGQFPNERKAVTDILAAYFKEMTEAKTKAPTATEAQS